MEQCLILPINAASLGAKVIRILGGVRATAFFAAALGFALSTWYYHNKSEKLALRIQVMELKSEQQAKELKAARENVTTKVETIYVDRIKTVYKRGAEIIKEVPVYVPSTTPDLPAGFRVLYDAASRGELPDPAAVNDAAPVSAQTVATSVIENFTICRANAEKLLGLQEWVTRQLGVKISEVGYAKKAGVAVSSAVGYNGGMPIASPPLQFGEIFDTYLTDQ
jgi:hypothetical protein